MKVELGAKNCLYPMPITLVGTMMNDEANYSTIAHVGVMDLNTISISVSKHYYTSSGIKQHGCFSLNIPSTEQVKEAEYCGLVSGKKANKGELFENFFGTLAHAPMIRECPINMECQLTQPVQFQRHIAETPCAPCRDRSAQAPRRFSAARTSRQSTRRRDAPSSASGRPA